MISHKEYWDDVPPLGRAGRRWFRRRLYHETQLWLRSETKVDPEDPENAQLIHTLVGELAAEPFEVLSWSDAAEYSGRGFSSGHYIVKAELVHRRLLELFAATAHRIDATDFQQLDDWLDALQRDVLYSPGPPEPSGTSLLEKLGVRICRTCRHGFTPDRRNAIRCPNCRPQRARKDAVQGRSE